MPIGHILLALSVVFIWGTNFVVIKYGLAIIPPFLFATLRFAISSLPLLAFVRPPQTPWRATVAFGLLQGAGIFPLMFFAINASISPGMASLVIQAQVFLTILVAATWYRERIVRLQVASLAIAAVAIAMIAWRAVDRPESTVTPLGLLLVLGAAGCWALSNLVARGAGIANMLQFMVWSSAVAVVPLVALSLVFEGPAAVSRSLVAADWKAWAAAVWQAVGNTLFGFGAWNWLLARHAAASVTPMALLVPVFGMGASALLLGEQTPFWNLCAATLLISALALNILAARRTRMLRPVSAASARIAKVSIEE